MLNQSDLQKKIVIIVGVVIGLMILFPPKVIVTKNPLFDQVHTESVGYHFIFDDPAGEQKKDARILLGDKVDEYVNSQIEWGKLFLQFIAAGGAGYGLLWFMKTWSA